MENEKHPGGRPSKYEDVDLEHVAKMVRSGMTDEQLAAALDVTRATIHNWKTNHKEFFDTLKENKPLSDGNVVRSLYERACGYEHYEDKVFMSDGVPVTETVIKHYPPDPTSMIFWLKNRQPDKWKDKREQEISVNEYNVNLIDDDDD